MSSSQKKIIITITMILSVLLAIVSYCGVFIPLTYERDAASMAAQGVGQDIVDLFLIVPLLIVVLPFIKKDNKLSLFIHSGTLFYILYSLLIYSFGVHFNYLFLFYCFTLGVALYAFIYIIYVLSGMEIESWFDKKMPSKLIGIFLILISVMFYLLWFKDILPAIFNNTVPKSVSDYNLLVNPVHVIDIAFALPGLIITAILLLKRNKFGYIFTAIALEFIVLLTIVLIAMVIMLKIRGISDDMSIAGVFAVLAVIDLTMIKIFFKSFKTK